MKHAIALLLLVPGLAACGSDPATCEITDNGDGTRTIACPGADPVRVVDGDADATCVIGSGDDGGKVISCSDGTLVRIDADGRVIFPGSGMVVGTARFFGLADHAGIRVVAVGTDIEATTDAEGRFEIGPLPAGDYELRFEAPGWVTEKRDNIPVINDEWRIKEPVILRVGRWVGGDWVAPAPAGDAVLVSTFGVSRTWLDFLDLVDPEAEPFLLTGASAGGRFDETGRSVLVQERLLIDGPLWLWDRATGVKTVVAEHSVAGWLVPGGEAVVYETVDEAGGCHLHLWQRASGAVTDVGACGPPPSVAAGTVWLFSTDGRRFVYVDEGGQHVIYDVATGGARDLPEGAMPTGAVFLGDGSKLLLRRWNLTGGHDLGTFDVSDGTWTPLAADVTEVIHAPTGDALVFVHGGGGTDSSLSLYDVERARVTALASAGFPWAMEFSTDGRRLLWLDAATNRLHVFDRDAPENVATAPGDRGVSSAGFRADGRQVALIDMAGELQLWDPGSGAVEFLGAATTGLIWNASHTHLAVHAEGEILAIDFAGGARHRIAAELPGLPVFEPDGAALLFNRAISGPRDTVAWEFVRWAPPAEPVVLASTMVRSVLFTPANNALFTECEEGCQGEMLVLWDRERAQRVPIDQPVTGFRHENGVLVYHVNATDPGQAARNGPWVARIP